MNVPKAFFYDWIDRTAYKKGKPLPDKIGSMQCFMNGFQGRHLPRDMFVITQFNQTHPISFEVTLGQGAQLLTHSTTQHTVQITLRSAFWAQLRLYAVALALRVTTMKQTWNMKEPCSMHPRESTIVLFIGLPSCNKASERSSKSKTLHFR